MYRWASRVAAEQCPSRASMSTSRTMFTTSTTTTSIITPHQTALKSTTIITPPIPGPIPSITQLPPTIPAMAIMPITANRTKPTNTNTSSKSRSSTRKRTAYLSWQSLPWRSLATSSTSVMPRVVSSCHSHPLNSHAQRLPLTVSERSYTFVKAVGDGSFGQVWLCDWHSHLPPHVTLARMQQGQGARTEWHGKRLVAIKRMKKRWEGGWDECKKHPELEVRARTLYPPSPPMAARTRGRPQMSKR